MSTFAFKSRAKWDIDNQFGFPRDNAATYKHAVKCTQR
jgi:hypothetical protein